MLNKWRLFLKVLNAYSLEEKVVSIIVIGCLLYLGIQTLGELFSKPVLTENVYTEGLVSDRPTLLNPLFVDLNETNRDLTALIFSGLTKYDPSTKNFINDLAELNLSPDHKTYTFTLKPNVLWHDGKAVTSEDIYFTYHELIQSPDFPNLPIKLNFEGIEIKKVDEKTIQFILKTPNSFFITNLNVGIVPKHILGNTPIQDLRSSSFNAKPVGTGPYKVDKALEIYGDRRQKVTLRAFEQYYGGIAKISEIHFNIYADEKDLLREKSAFNTVPKAPLQLKDEKNGEKFRLSDYELPQYTGVFFNLNNPLFEKEKVRLALVKSIDKNKLLEKLKAKKPVDTPILELNQSDWVYKPNLDEAKGALFDSGYKKDPNGPFRKDSEGNVLKFKLLVRAEESNEVIAFLKESWENTGIQIEVEAVDYATFRDRLQKREYDMILTGQSLGYNFDTYSYWHSSQANSRGLNLSNYQSFGSDQLIQQIRENFDSAKREQRVKELAAALARDLPAILLYRPQYTFASDGKVKNIKLENLAYPSDRFANILEWCMQCE